MDYQEQLDTITRLYAESPDERTRLELKWSEILQCLHGMREARFMQIRFTAFFNYQRRVAEGGPCISAEQEWLAAKEQVDRWVAIATIARRIHLERIRSGALRNNPIRPDKHYADEDWYWAVAEYERCQIRATDPGTIGKDGDTYMSEDFPSEDDE